MEPPVAVSLLNACPVGLSIGKVRGFVCELNESGLRGTTGGDFSLTTLGWTDPGDIDPSGNSFKVSRRGGSMGFLSS